jgi:hypothetical protein
LSPKERAIARQHRARWAHAAADPGKTVTAEQLRQDQAASTFRVAQYHASTWCQHTPRQHQRIHHVF